jgi:hypothetical protein
VVQRATAELPPYKDSVPQELEADYLGPNSRIAVAWFVTSDTLDEVLGFYYQTLLEAGLPVVSHLYNENAGYVGHVDPATKEAHLVSALDQGGQTWVFVSSGDAHSLLKDQDPLPEELPMPTGAQEPVVLSFRQEGRIRYSVHADVPQGRTEELVAFYRTAFGAQGWTLESGQAQEAGAMHMLASRGRDRISALVQPRTDGAQLLLTLDKQELAQ